MRRIDATPTKAIFRSIIADYGLNLAICELIDNALDAWSFQSCGFDLVVDVEIDIDQQSIVVVDNSGGLSADQMVLFVSPGRTGNSGDESTIGIFGVGSKRAAVSLAQEIRFTSRGPKGQASAIEYNDKWLDNESWMIEVRKGECKTRSTKFELYKLRAPILEEDIYRLIDHLGASYGLFLENESCCIRVNGEDVPSRRFDQEWAFPDSYPPKQFKTILPIEESEVKVSILGGVIGESGSAGGESGIYFYCNNRLVARALKDYEVGYYRGAAGQANHPGAALGRVIVELKGAARFMPWNSSKSAVNYQHKVFTSIRSSIVEVVKYYVGLSRRTQGDWPGKIYRFDTGEVEVVELDTLDKIKRINDVPLPKTRKRYDERLVEWNKNLGKKKPWVIGLYEGIATVDLISKKSFSQKNRFSLIVLDSTLEIAMKDFLLYERRMGIGAFNRIAQNRTEVVNAIKDQLEGIEGDVWDTVNYYYQLRNSIIHQRASEINDEHIASYRQVVESLLIAMFGLQF